MTTAFVDGPVITGDGRILEHATVLVEDDKILRVADRDINIPPKATKIPLDDIDILCNPESIRLVMQAGNFVDGDVT